MAEDDDRVHEDVQVAAMTGGAAAARTAEILLRAQQDRRPDSRRSDNRTHPYHSANQAEPASQPGVGDRNPAVSDEVTADFLRARQAADQMNPMPAAEITRPSTIPTTTAAPALHRQPQRQRGAGISR